jgi:hypothetical protein
MIFFGKRETCFLLQEITWNIQMHPVSCLNLVFALSRFLDPIDSAGAELRFLDAFLEG